MTINAMVFDMDDTLYEEKEYIKSGFKTLDQWVIHKFKLTGFYEIALYLFNSGERKFLFDKTLEKLNLVYDDKLIKEMVELYRSHEPNIHLFEDAKWIFDNLKGTVKIGLISDGYLIAQEKKVNALKLRDKIHSVILTDKLGREYWKPSHIPYEQVSLELRVPHDQCVYIGDNINKDFITAKKLGWTTIRIERQNGVYSGIVADQEYEAHFTIDNLRKLLDLPMLNHIFA